MVVPAVRVVWLCELQAPLRVAATLLVASPDSSDSLLGCADVALLEVIDKLSAVWQLR